MIRTGKNYYDLLYLDIETVRGASKIFEIGGRLGGAWGYLCSQRYKEELTKGETLASLFTRDAALYPEFGKIVCISLGYFTKLPDNSYGFKVKALVGRDEKSILKQFSDIVTKFSVTYKILCGHNLKQFDIPYIIRRSIVNSINLPISFDLYGKKPWDLETLFIDTREMWAGLAFNLGSSSLESVSAALGIPSPKTDMSGADVSTIFYAPADVNGKDGLPTIGKYCNGDIICTAQVYKGMTLGDISINIISNE
jgi:3'-5' exonuclease